MEMGDKYNVYMYNYWRASEASETLIGLINGYRIYRPHFSGAGIM